MRRPLTDYNALLSTYSSGGLTVAPNWQGGASFSVQLNGKYLLYFGWIKVFTLYYHVFKNPNFDESVTMPFTEEIHVAIYKSTYRFNHLI